MHRHAFPKLTNIIALWCIGLAFILGCNDHPCPDLNCVNGICNNGECVCDQGWTDANCDSLIRDRLLGNLWQNSLHCQSSSNLYTASITAAIGGDDDAIDIHNLYVFGDSVRAIVTTDTLWVPQQVYGLDYIGGWAVYNRSSFTLDFKVQTSTGNETNCLAVFQR